MYDIIRCQCIVVHLRINNMEKNGYITGANTFPNEFYRLFVYSY